MISINSGVSSRLQVARPDALDSDADAPHDLTLTVGRYVSLTLGSDSLLIVDERSTRKPDRRCCGLLGTPGPDVTHAIALYNILDAELSSAGLTITYAKHSGSDDVSVTPLQYPIDDEQKTIAQEWVAKLLDLAYGDARRHKRLKVLINPFGGKGAASYLYQTLAAPVFAAAHCQVDVQETTHSGHATEICEQMDVNAYDVIVCASGDGVPYEVFNGLAKKPNAREALAKLAVAMIPCGSGNAMAWNLYGTDSVSISALAIVKGLQTPLDLMSVTQGSCHTLSFLSQSFGIVAESDLGTDNIRWMGAARFTYGFLVRLFQRTIYPCDLAMKVILDDKKAIKDHYTAYANDREAAKRRPDETAGQSGGGPVELHYGTVMDELPTDWEVIPAETIGNFYAGNMATMAKETPFFPAALPSDGLMDIVTIDGTISRITSLKMMTEIPAGGFFSMPDVKIRKVAAYRLVPREKEGYISIDGEKVPFEAFQVEIHKGLGTVLSKSGHLYETEGPRL